MSAPAAPAAPAADAPLSGIHLPSLPSLSAFIAIHNEIGMILTGARKVRSIPLASKFFPKLNMLDEMLPELEAAHNFGGDLMAAAGDPGKMLAAVEKNFPLMLAAAKGAAA